MVDTRRSKRINSTVTSNLPLVETKCGKRNRTRNKNNITEDEVETPASKFMSSVSDDLLIQILLRLPHAHDVIWCSAVCKRWYSVISTHEFARDFLQYGLHKRSSGSSSYSLPYTLLFINQATNRFIDLIEQPGYQIFSEHSKIIHGIGKPTTSSSSPSSSTTYLNFLRRAIERNVLIKASFDDVLFVATPDADFYICNPLTKQWIALPRDPLIPSHTGQYGLVCEPKYMSCNKQLPDTRFRVVRTTNFSRLANHHDYRFHMRVFCSETGGWSESTFLFACPLPGLQLPLFFRFVASNGTLYGLLEGEDSEEIKGILAINPFEFDNVATAAAADPRQCRFIGLPEGLVRGWRAHDKRLCLGAVSGRLRLSQLRCVKRANGFELRVWELNLSNNSDALEQESWILVHDVRLKRTPENRKMSVLSFHPSNGDLIFVLCGNNKIICKYKIGEGEYETVGEFSDGNESLNFKYVYFREILRVFTVVYPSWPTPIPSLPPV